MGLFSKKEPIIYLCSKCENNVNETDKYCVNCNTSIGEILKLDEEIKKKKLEYEIEQKSIISSNKNQYKILDNIKKKLNNIRQRSHFGQAEITERQYDQNYILIQQNELIRRQNEKIIALLEKLVDN